LCSAVAGGVTRNIVSLFREPDAGICLSGSTSGNRKQSYAKPD
jgi:hypothetical protein